MHEEAAAPERLLVAFTNLILFLPNSERGRRTINKKYTCTRSFVFVHKGWRASWPGATTHQVDLERWQEIDLVT